MSFEQDRWRMVREQIHARGVRDPQVLEAMSKVPRELFVPAQMRRHSYEDRPLPIGHEQTISQPYIVAFMVEALNLQATDRVLEVGAGCGYAAAVLGQIVAEVYTIERLQALAQMAGDNLLHAGCENVHVRHADGTEGWADESPFDAILVSASGPKIPDSLLRQLKVGGCLVIPIGTRSNAQELVRITKRGDGEYQREDLATVRFVPLIGAQGWEEPEQVQTPRVIQARPHTTSAMPDMLVQYATHFRDPEEADLTALLRDIGDARIVLIGEASHGTSEFYRLRARITQHLIRDKGFRIVAAEADWPDAARIDHYVRHRETPPAEWRAFARFPTWMWRNAETSAFVDWLHAWNASREFAQRAGFYGLDLYSLYTSVHAVLAYLDERDPQLAEIARVRYGCLSPWEADPAAYGQAALNGRYRSCEQDVAHVLVELMLKRQSAHEQAMREHQDRELFFDAVQNANLVSSAERYYRTMYYGSRASWNLRDEHMFQTLKRVMAHQGEASKAVVWAHNSHIGDARATEMSLRGEHNLGQLCAQTFPNTSYRIGFGTDRGTVAAASNWDAPMEIMQVMPAHKQSHEYQFHLSQASGLILPFNHAPDALREELAMRRLERAIGVIYRPQTEMASHYFEADLAEQFDAYIWIDQSSAVTPLATHMLQGMPDTYPFGE